MYTDRVLKCRDCHAEFTWTAAEQQFFEQSGLRNAPRRCRPCRVRKKAAESGARAEPRPERSARRLDPRPMHATTCSECGQQAMVPFEPNPSRAAYCTDCFRRRRALVTGTT